MDPKTKLPVCQYVPGETDDYGTEALKLYLPAKDGYIHYTIIHSVHEKKGCDTWRLGPVYHCDDSLLPVAQLTRPRAEWEMAIRLLHRPDFIGGIAHGDERFESLSITLDGQARSLNDLAEKTTFDTLTVIVHSVGFDPSNPTEQVLLHKKKLIARAGGVSVDQTVEWLCERKLASSYMAMLPSLKEHTDHFRTENDEAPRPIVERKYSEAGHFKTLCLTGKKYSFTMTVEKYLTAPEGNTFIISDNGGDTYNKMYFMLMHGGEAHRGDVWNTQTRYLIETL